MRPAVGRVAVLLLILGAEVPTALRGQKAPPPIQDNSFLVEEAYNQEARVVQHISQFIYDPSGRAWNYAFTQEWPAGGLTNQLSYTLALAGVRQPNGQRRTTLGDALLNYRYQLVGSGETRVAVAPRFSLVLPTGDASAGTGRGAPGYQVNLPASIVLTPTVVTHLNAGFTVTPRAQSPTGARVTLHDVAGGGSLIWLARPRLNFMLESLWSRSEQATGAGAVASTSWLLSPGVRGAFNFRNGLQIVPGLAIPVEMQGTAQRGSLLLYLSFEHPF